MKISRIFTAAMLFTALIVISCDSGSGPDNEAPSIPTGLEFYADSSGDGQLMLVWDENPESDVHFYRIFRSVGNGNAFSQLNETEELSYVDRGLDYDTDYYYEISAVDKSDNESERSNTVNAKPLNINSPARPEIEATTAINSGDNSYIRLVWTENTEADFDHYEIYRGTNSIFGINESSLLTTTESNSHMDRTVEIGTRYYYKIIAVDRGGLNSNTSSITDDIVLPVPVLLSPVNDNEASSLTPEFSWERVNGAVKYTLSVKTSESSGEITDPFEVDQNDSGNLSFTYPGNAPDLENNKRYFWSVTTYSKDEGSVNSESESQSFWTPAK